MSRRNRIKNNNAARDRTPTVIRQDHMPMSTSDSLAIGFAAFLVTLVLFLIGYAVVARFDH